MSFGFSAPASFGFGTRPERAVSALHFSRWTIGTRISALVLNLLVLLNLVIIGVIWHLAESASEAQRTGLMFTARSVVAAADAKLDKYIALAQALARSPALLEDNLDAFEAEARRAFASSPDALVVVADNGGRQLLNTARQPGQALRFRDPIGLDTEERAFENHETVISDIHFDAVSQHWVVHIEVPIFKEGEPFRTLVAAVKAQSFFGLLNDQHLPEGWIAAILDGQGRFIARATERDDDERYIGQLSSQSWRNLKNQNGIFEVHSSEGDPAVAANTHSTLSGWRIAVAVKTAAMQAAAWRAVRWALILGGGFSIWSLLLAAIIARSITGPIDGLRNKAAALLAGPLRGLPAVGPPEVKELWRALQLSAADRRRSEAALRESEGRFRGIFEHAGTGIAIADLEGRIQTCNPAYAAMLGYSGQELQGLVCLNLIHPGDREANLAEKRRLLAHKIPSFEIISRYIGKGDKLIWVHKHVSLLCDGEGRPTGTCVLATDITGRKRQDDHIRFLMREVNHRSKNMLALVQAVARQTLAANPDDFLERFGKRVEALAANQDLLVKNAWKGVDLNELVRSQLGHFEDLIGTRIGLKGPALIISASAAQALGMALHELATNAGKYGALCGANGFVEIDWRVERGQRSPEMFVMSWRERCAHSVTAPSKLGFGSSVISCMAEKNLNAQVELDYPSTGLTWQLSCAAGEVVEGGSLPNIASERSTGGNERTNRRPRVLVVEDEALVAMEIAHALTEAGFDVAGPARNVPAALEILKRQGCDAAVLDINLGRETSEAIAIELTANRTPFVTLSGYSSEQHHPAFTGAPALRKPLRLQFLVAEIKKCVGHKHGEPVDRTEASTK